MLGIENYIAQFIKEPVFSNTRWASTTGTSVDIDETTNGPILILCYIAIINTVATQSLRLQDNYSTNIIWFDPCNVNAVQQFQISHILKVQKVTFTCTGCNGFSIGYQYITEKQK